MPKPNLNNRNFYWLYGDRFLCVNRKNEIVSELQKRSPHRVESFGPVDSANEFCSKLSQGSLFGAENVIYYYDGSVPEPAKSTSFIEKLPSNKTLIVVEPSIMKMSTLFKKLGKNSENFPLVYDGRRVDHQARKEIFEILNQIVKCEKSILSFIFEKCDFDPGRTCSEVEKVTTYLGRAPKELEDLRYILSVSDDINVNILTDALRENKIVNAIKIINDMYENSDFESQTIPIIGAIRENIEYQLYCRMAIDEGNTDIKDIALFVEKNVTKPESGGKSKKFFSQSVINRWYYYQKIVLSSSTDKISKQLVATKKAYDDCISSVLNKKHIVLRMLLEMYWA